MIIEELTMNAWPALKTYMYDGWLLRLSNGYTKRANSISPLYGSNLDYKSKIRHCMKLYGTQGLPTIFKLTTLQDTKELESILSDEGFSKLDDTSVYTVDLEESYGDTQNPRIDIKHGYSNSWANEYIMIRNITDGQTIRTLKTMLASILDDVLFFTYRFNDIPVGFGYCVITDEYAGLYNLYVAENFRGEGIGESLVRAMLNEGVKRGAKKAYLQVVIGNNVAVSLYDKLGFKENYRYWYMKK